MPSVEVLTKVDGENISTLQLPHFEIQKPKHLRALEQIRRMRGGSQSHLLRCSDNRYYIVKFQGNPQGTRTLANEFLGTLLATRLGLPTTEIAICYVDEQLIRLTDEMYVETETSRVPCQPGLQFASRFPVDPHRVTVLDFLPDMLLMRLKNLRDFLGMLVFDKWTCNTDPRQNVFFRREVGRRYETVMIDQGNCFNGCEWSFPDDPRKGLCWVFPRLVYRQVFGMSDFEPWLAKLETEINETVLTNIAEDIPPEWYESDPISLRHLLEQLDLRRNKVAELLWNTWKTSRDCFPNWKLQMAVGQA